MRRPLGYGVIVCALLHFACASAGTAARQAPGSAAATDRSASAEIEKILQQYVRAVNDADTTLLRGVWDPGDSASYIHPNGRVRTWAELAGFWQRFLGNTFSAREFTPNTVTIRDADDVAWVVFNWDFKATRTNGELYQSRGWETQLYRRTPRGWRIAHVHFSSAPRPGQ